MIPLTKPYVPRSTQEKILDALGSSHLQGGGPYSIKCESKLMEIAGTGKVKLTPSCTSALELSSLLIELKRDDEVIIPSFNFSSAALSSPARRKSLKNSTLRTINKLRNG